MKKSLVLLFLLCGCQHYNSLVDFMADKPSEYWTDNSGILASNTTTVYNASQCIGAIVNGVCNGSIMPDGGYHQTCYGQMIGGICTGPMY